jgi:hypothetical protein
VPAGIEIRLLETPGTDMLMDAIMSMGTEGLGGMQGMLINRFYKGGVKEAFVHAVKNTFQPVLHGRLSVPEYIEPVIEEPEEVATETVNSDAVLPEDDVTNAGTPEET